MQALVDFSTKQVWFFSLAIHVGLFSGWVTSMNRNTGSSWWVIVLWRTFLQGWQAGSPCLGTELGAPKSVLRFVLFFIF